jgi:hypothetical protein
MSLFSAVSPAGESELLMDFLDTGLQAGLIAKKEDLLSHMQWFLKQKTEAYEQCLFPGLAFSKILLMAKIFAVSYPELKLPESAPPKSAYVALPFGSYMSHLRFVCGRYDCRHAMCEYRRREILSETGLPAGVGGTLLAHRDFAAYCGSNRISMIVLLQSVHSHKQGRQFIQKAADELRVEGESLREALLDAKSVSEFYHLHYQLIPYFQAATIAYTFLSKTAEAPQHPDSLEDSADADDEKEAMRLQANRCEEFMARSGGALCCDFANAIDLASLREARATIAWLKEESKSKFQPHNYLNKVLRDERWYPSFWRDFLLGESETIPISLKRDYRWQRLVSRFHQTWPPRSH